MRILSTFFAFTGIILIVFKIFGVYADANTQYFFIAGMLFMVASLVLLIRIKIIRNHRIKSIIENYKHKDPYTQELGEDIKTGFKGWSMNNSPFRKRKSGLTWSGGNIKGANASRNERR